VHVGRHIVVELDARDRKAAEQSAREMCDRLLANPVTEDYEIAGVDDGVPPARVATTSAASSGSASSGAAT
jgi:hypothetical protein